MMDTKQLATILSCETSHSPEVCAEIIRAMSERCQIEVLETEEQTQEWNKRLAATEGQVETLCEFLYSLGFDSPIKGKYLAAELGISERELRDIVALSRKKIREGTIISGTYGYKITRDPEKIQESIERLRLHSISQLVAARDMKRGMPVGQMRLL